MELKYRKDVPVELTWDLSIIYKNEDELWKDAEKLKGLVEEISSFKGKLNTAENINACLDIYQRADCIMQHLLTYCELSVSVDYYDTHASERNDKVNDLIAAENAKLSFMESEILGRDDETLKKAISESKDNARYLKDLLEEKPHHLSEEKESLLKSLNSLFQVPYGTYNTTKLADMKFDNFEVDGVSYPLGYSLFEDDYVYEKNTAVRRAAFDAFSKKIRQYENTTAFVYNSHVQMEKKMADLRGYSDVYAPSLAEQKVTREMYERHIDTIMEKLAPHMRRYAKLKQRLHHLDKMTFADLKVELDPGYDPRVTIAESRNYIKNGLSILGEDYGKIIDAAYDQRWVDFAKNQGKSTGGFCAFVPEKNCYILLSWNDRMADVLTLAHELGHTGNAILSNRKQSVLDSMPPSYLGEAPSTMNEILMANYLLKTSDDKRFRRWVLSCMLSGTYYHNFVTHLLEGYYQREVYRIVDAGGSVSAPVLSELFKKTLEKFWGDAVEINDGAELTWMRQPHYYMGLYSYTYSAGLSLGTQVALRIQKEGEKAVEDWKKFLESGCTLSPVEVGKAVGVDIEDVASLEATIDYIGSLVDEVERLTDELEKENQ